MNLPVLVRSSDQSWVTTNVVIILLLIIIIKGLSTAEGRRGNVSRYTYNQQNSNTRTGCN